MTTALDILTAIKTAEWHRYTGHDFTDMEGYVTAGTHGTPDAINLRCALPLIGLPVPQFIEYQRVGEETWKRTGYSAVMRYDYSRDITDDGEGYDFIPYHVTELQITTV